jgi:hypothetical protein
MAHRPVIRDDHDVAALRKFTGVWLACVAVESHREILADGVGRVQCKDGWPFAITLVRNKQVGLDAVIRIDVVGDRLLRVAIPMFPFDDL